MAKHKTNTRQRVKRGIAFTAAGLLPVVPALADPGDGVAGGSGMMGGWTGWVWGWMGIFPALLMTLVVLGIVWLVKAISTPPPVQQGAQTPQDDPRTPKEG